MSARRHRRGRVDQAWQKGEHERVIKRYGSCLDWPFGLYDPNASKPVRLREAKAAPDSRPALAA